jgi:hypothetical protein
MKLIKLLILGCCIHGIALSQDIVLSLPDSGLKVLTAASKNFTVPAQLQKYAGVRFVDVRYFKDFIGFLSSYNSKNLYKLDTQKALEEELNNTEAAVPQDAVSSDSILIVLKNFWVNRNANVKHGVYCHVSALFFIKKNEDAYFDFKVDTFFNYKDPFGDFYKSSINTVVKDLLASYKEPEKFPGKKYSYAELNENLQKKRPGVRKVKDSMGVFFTYKDFVNGNLFLTPVTINPFFDQYTFQIENENLNIQFHKKIWGLIYKGALYIRNDNFLSKAFPTGGSYIARSNFEIREAGTEKLISMPGYTNGNNNISADAQAVGMLAGSVIINLLKRKNARIKSFPMILNIETGELE